MHPRPAFFQIPLAFLFCWLLTSAAAAPQPPAGELKLWFNQPAASWNEALPVGNGQLGAMVFGGVASERLQLNEETVWTGKPADFVNPKAKAALPQVRQLLFSGKYAEAEQLAQASLMGEQKIHSTYQTLGDLVLDFGAPQQVSAYRRELDLETAVARVSYQAGKVRYTREVFASAPDQALVVRLTADAPGALTLAVKLSRPGNKARITAAGQELVMREHVNNGEGVQLAARLQVQAEGGRVQAVGDHFEITQADAVTLVFTAATNYRGQDPLALAGQQLAAAAQKSYAGLQATHIRDYQQYFRRLRLDLGSSEAVYFPTDTRVAAMQQGNEDPQLLQLYYQFGRYLLISSSRPGGLPANLQGIWADGLNPPWSADYHININIQMNYWLAEQANLSELHLPYLAFIDKLRVDGQKTARDMYGVKGAVAHYTTDPWLFTETAGHPVYAMWPMGLAWSAQHLWEHYLFTEDKAYLKKLAYPNLKAAAEFCANFLVKNPATGYLVSGPSISPENKFKTSTGVVATMVMGPTMDHMIIRDLLTNTIAAAKVLNTDAAFRKRLTGILARLSPTRIHSDGRIMEWTEEFAEPEPGHRHISHLFGLHPGREITRQSNPALLAAARKTIDYRLAHGGGHTGWSRAWVINFFARLQDGDAAYENLLALLRKSTLPNLFDNHPPFQIDGNFGATAGITEMLLQSHAGEIELLPALPAAWPTGYLHGVCARGGFELNLDWQAGKLQQVKVLSKLGNTCQLRYGGQVITLQTQAGKTYTFNGALKQL